MSAPGKARRRLPYVDPAKHTPHFSWMKRGKSGREVFCEKVRSPKSRAALKRNLYV